MKARLFFIFLIVLSISAIARSQEAKSHELSQIPIPEQVKQEIVRRILIFKFKPASRQRVIHLAKEGLDPAWLPKIPNIKFRLLSDEEIEDREHGVYFFTAPQLTNKTYNIGFAYGDPECDYTGDGWRFRVTRERLRVWYAGGIGGGCCTEIIKLYNL